MSTLARYKLPLQPAPEPVLLAVNQGVRSASFEPVQDAQKVLGGAQAPANGVCRDPQGRVRITCVTDMPGVTPAMIDWWFGWHLPFTERYALWHPTAHVRSVVKEDRSHVIDDR
ncbi:DAPG hydrolase family protein, partial [Novosphingopyxis sp. YJ-S2-01]|uniref:DAPG hydrolase family protein n=1 Tax=Novosphingopyxis sp. YJ-S2-01 TaxID=2794021 RepID=UPI001E4E9C79